MASLSGFLNTDALAQRMGALSQPAYRRYWLGSVASVGSVQLIIVGQGWLIVNELGGSPIDLGYLGAASALPTIAVNTFGGVVADRVNPHFARVAGLFRSGPAVSRIRKR